MGTAMTTGGRGKDKLMATRTRTGAATEGKTASKPAERKANAAAPARFGAIRRLARDTYQETKKIVWPDRETTRNLTVVVIGLSVFLGAILGGVDALFVRLWQLF
jgi:preprotein translocase subunit SecE